MKNTKERVKIMKLEDIGFYTLSNQRASKALKFLSQPVARVEFIITDACNFKCKYCRGIETTRLTFVSFKQQFDIIQSQGPILNIRFSGGEPTLNKDLPKMVTYCKTFSQMQHIAVSTNGSNTLEHYKNLVALGVNDFSISLDGCCSKDIDKLAGASKVGNNVLKNIKELSKLCYVSVGIVITQENEARTKEIILKAHNLGVQDIRIIPSAQYNILKPITIAKSILKKHPILNYRLENLKNGVPIRGLQDKDSLMCPLVLDDLAILNGYHYPCIIYMREGGAPIGRLQDTYRFDRFSWYLRNPIHDNEICKRNCLDVCIAYNNLAAKYY